MNIHRKYVSVGYKFSTSRKNDPVTILTDDETLTQMFEYAIPLALAVKKGALAVKKGSLVAKKGKAPHTKPFKVHLFEVLPKSDNTNIEREPVRAKAKQGSNYHTIFIYVLIKMQAPKPMHSVMDAEHDAVDAGTHGQNIIKLQQKYPCPTKEHTTSICLIGPKPEEKHVLLTIGQMSGWAQLIVGTRLLA